MKSLSELREDMIRNQLQVRGINDIRVLEAFRKLRREDFIPSEVKERAYDDSPLLIGEEQTISQPFIVAYMTQAAMIQATDKVLEIGTGSGFQTAVLAELAKAVYTIERIKKLGESARQRLDSLAYKNIKFKIDDGHFGWEEYAPYEVILATAAPEHVPHPLRDQLAPGGRLIIPVGGEREQRLLRITRRKQGFHEEMLMPVRFVPFISPH